MKYRSTTFWRSDTKEAAEMIVYDSNQFHPANRKEFVIKVVEEAVRILHRNATPFRGGVEWDRHGSGANEWWSWCGYEARKRGDFWHLYDGDFLIARHELLQEVMQFARTALPHRGSGEADGCDKFDGPGMGEFPSHPADAKSIGRRDQAAFADPDCCAEDSK